MLQFRQLSYQIGHRTLVNQVTADINDHDFIIITGQSGSGKSLLLKLLASLLPISTGQITLNGKSVTQLTPRVWRSHIAYVAQMGEMIDGSVLDNLALPFCFDFYQDKQIDVSWHQQQLVSLGKTAEFLDQDSRNLSGGEKQLVNVLRTLQLHPTILLLDEPTASLDPATTGQVEDMIAQWYQSNPGASVVWVSHAPTQIERLLSLGASHWSMDKGALTIHDKRPLASRQAHRP